MYIFDKERTITQFKENSQPNKTWAKDLNGHFTKEVIQMAKKHMKKYSLSLGKITS